MSKHLWVQFLDQILHCFFEYMLLLSWLCFSLKHVFAGIFTTIAKFLVSFLFWLFLGSGTMCRLKKKSFTELAICLTLVAFFTFLSNTAMWSSSVEGQSCGWDLWGDASLLKIMKNISFYKKKTTNPMGSTEAFISKLNCFCPLFLENLQGASRFWMLMFAISCKRKYPSPQFLKNIKLYTYLNIHISVNCWPQRHFCALEEILSLFFLTSISQSHVKHFLTAFVNNISRFIPRLGICLAIG